MLEIWTAVNVKEVKFCCFLSIIRKIFTKKEPLGLVTSNFYSILYYNSEIWHLPTLKPSLKQKLLSASAKALKVCCRINDYMISFATIHTLCNCATPNQMLQYKLALCLFKLYNNDDYNPIEFLSLNCDQVFTSAKGLSKF